MLNNVIRRSSRIDNEKSFVSIYLLWYTPIQKFLHVLSLLYSCVDVCIVELDSFQYTIMADITVEAVSNVLIAIQRATSIIETAQVISTLLTYFQSVIDGELFRVKTLLILREQISPFDLHSPGTYLPFSDRSLTESTLFRLFAKAIPTITFINQDGLKLIETALKDSTNRLIEAICRTVCGPVILIIQEYEHYMATTASSTERFPLFENQVISILTSFQEGVEGLDDIVGKIALYVDSPATQGILFAPVRVRVRQKNYEQRMLLGYVSHLKEILVYLKPNNFPRYLDQLSELENEINAVDATKFNHDTVKRGKSNLTEETEVVESEEVTKNGLVVEDIETAEHGAVTENTETTDVVEGKTDTKPESNTIPETAESVPIDNSQEEQSPVVQEEELKNEPSEQGVVS